MGQIRVSGRNIYLGLFHDRFVASRAYDLASILIYPIFGQTNERIGLIPEGTRDLTTEERELVVRQLKKYHALGG